MTEPVDPPVDVSPAVTSAMIPRARDDLRKTRGVDDLDDDDYAFIAKVVEGQSPARRRRSLGVGLAMLSALAAVAFSSAGPVAVGAVVLLLGAVGTLIVGSRRDVVQDLLEAGYRHDVVDATLAATHSFRGVSLQFNEGVQVRSEAQYAEAGRALLKRAKEADPESR